MGYFIKNLKQLDNKYDKELLIWRNKEHVRDMMITKKMISQEEHEKYLSKIYKSISYDIYIGFKEEIPFGVVNIWKVDSETQVYEYGYYLIDEKDLNSGLGILMEYFAIERIFQIGKDISIELNTFTYNKKTIGLHKRFGYRITEEKDQLCKQILRYKDWSETKGKIEKLLKEVYKINCEVFINE